MTQDVRNLIEGMTLAFRQYIEQMFGGGLESFQPIPKPQVVQTVVSPDLKDLIAQLVPVLEAIHLKDFVRKDEVGELMRRMENLEREKKSELITRLLASSQFVEGIEEIIERKMSSLSAIQSQQQETDIRQEIAQFLGLNDPELVATNLVEAITSSGSPVGVLMSQMLSETSLNIAKHLGYQTVPKSQKDSIEVYARYLMARGEYQRENSIAEIVDTAIGDGKLKRRK